MAGWLHKDLSVLGLPGLWQVLVLQAARAWDLRGTDSGATRLHRDPTRPYKCRAEDVAPAKAHRTRRGAWQPGGQRHPQPGQDASPRKWGFLAPSITSLSGKWGGMGLIHKGMREKIRWSKEPVCLEQGTRRNRAALAPQGQSISWGWDLQPRDLSSLSLA